MKLASVTLFSMLSISTSAFAGVPGYIDLNPTHILKPIQGEISKVVTKAADAEATSLLTEVTVSYTVDCTEKLENFSSKWDYSTQDANKIDLYVSAVVSVAAVPSDLVCLGISNVEKVVTLPPGFYDESQINLINVIKLGGNNLHVNLDGMVLNSSADVKVVAVEPLCPSGVVCIFGGTIVTIEFSSCGFEVGPTFFVSSQSVEQSLVGELDLAVTALALEEASGCSLLTPVTHQVQLTLVSQYADLDGIQLKVLSSAE